ncbi:MAG: hypothetical protein DRN68_05760, partial [Thaumarchaeota archaeon]
MRRAIVAILVIVTLALGSIFAAYFLSLQEKELTTSSATKPTKIAPIKSPLSRSKHMVKKHPTTSLETTSKTINTKTGKSTLTSKELTRSETVEHTETVKLSFPYIYEKPANWNKKCIIFVHGMGRDKSVWRRDMDEFKKHGYCVFAFDLPYHGERGRYNPGHFYDVVYQGSKEIILIEKFLRA